MVAIVGSMGPLRWFFEYSLIYYSPLSYPLLDDPFLEEILDLSLPSPGYAFQSFNQLVFEHHH
jgi:hypothetical protein